MVVTLSRGAARFKSIPVLVCSANLGNACPDAASLQAWIPEDGRCQEVLMAPRYPIHEDQGEIRSVGAVTAAQPRDVEPSDAHEQFLIVVIGMQEATWSKSGPPPTRDSLHSSGGAGETIDGGEPESTGRLAEPATADGDGSNEVAAAGRSPRSASFPRRRRSLAASIAKPLQKAVHSVRGLTASRDHTRNRSRRRTTSSSSDHPAQSDSQHQPGSVSQWDFGTIALHRMLEARLPSYQRLVSFQRGEMRLEVFVLRSLVETSEVSVLQVSAQNTGRAGLANKGGIAAELVVLRSRMAFVTCHLEAHEGRSKYDIRCSTMADILHGTRGKMHDVSISATHCFVLGDLNFRTEMDAADYSSEEDHKAKVRGMVKCREWEQLNSIDELHRALRNKDCLVGFRTLPCYFPPTFKVERRPGYDYIEKRRPSYTDRILWKGPGLRPDLYEPIDEFSSSDHKPIRAAFMVPVPPRLRMRPRLSRYGASSSLERSLRWASIRSTRSTASVAHKNKLFLFVSQIRCCINQSAEGGGSSLPNPYLVLVTSPDTILNRKVRNWDKIKSFVRFGHVSSLQNADGSTLRLAYGWPRSCVKRSTYEPCWTRDEEEIQCQVQTHTRTGESIDLTGSLLYITLMNDSKNIDPVVGSVQYDLAWILRRCISPDGSASTSARDLSKRQTGPAASTKVSRGVSSFLSAPAQEPLSDQEEHSNNEEAGGSSVRLEAVDRSRRKSQLQAAVRRTSILNSLFGLSATRAANDAEDDEDPIVFDVVREPLLKCGRQVGTIECRIEAWWMNQFTSRSLAAVGGSGVPSASGKRRVGDRPDDPLHASARPYSGPAPTVFSQRHPIANRRPKRHVRSPF